MSNNLCHGYDDEAVHDRERTQKPTPIDPNTLPAGLKTDVMVCGWCEPEPRGWPTKGYYAPVVSEGGWWIFTSMGWKPNKQPSTNHAHAVEAMLKADISRVYDNGENIGVLVEKGGFSGWGQVRCREANDSKLEALALATCRAIAAAMKAAEAAKEKPDAD